MSVRHHLLFAALRNYPLAAICLCFSPLFCQSSLIAQTKPAQPQMGGVNTGEAHAAVLDSQHRPITAGGFVKTGPIVFQDIAQKAGLNTWKHTMGTPEKHYIIETNGSGVGLIDYDNDGWLDIYF